MLTSAVERSNRSAWTSVPAGLLILFACFCLPSFARKQEKPAQPLKQDEACLACHGQAGMKSEKGVDISIRPEKHAASVHGVLGCKDCHTGIKNCPHPATISKVQCASCHADQAAEAAKSVHAALGETACASCHGNVHEIGAATKAQPAKCSECHAEEVKELAESIHGRATKAGDPDAPTCVSCHGPVPIFSRRAMLHRQWQKEISRRHVPNAMPIRGSFRGTKFRSFVQSNNTCKAFTVAPSSPVRMRLPAPTATAFTEFCPRVTRALG